MSLDDAVRRESERRGERVSIPWRLAAGERPSGDVLRIAFDALEYLTAHRVVALEDTDHVELAVRATWDPPDGGWFVSANEVVAEVRLSAPLGGRDLVHAPTDWPILWEPGMKLPD